MENWIHNHVFLLQAVLACGRKFIDEGHSSSDDIKTRCDQLEENWDELKNLAEQRQHKLEQSLAYQQFSANVGEEESWINEKNTLVGSDDYGDTLAAVQVRELSHVIHSLVCSSSCFCLAMNSGGKFNIQNIFGLIISHACEN